MKKILFLAFMILGLNAYCQLGRLGVTGSTGATGATGITGATGATGSDATIGVSKNQMTLDGNSDTVLVVSGLNGTPKLIYVWANTEIGSIGSYGMATYSGSYFNTVAYSLVTTNLFGVNADVISTNRCVNILASSGNSFYGGVTNIAPGTFTLTLTHIGTPGNIILSYFVLY